MKSILIPILTVTALFTLATTQPPPTTNPPLPSGHPTTNPQLPAGHPSVEAPFPAKSEDVSSVNAVLDAYYQSISGPKGTPRDWDRFRSLFVAEARFISLKPEGPGRARPFAMTTAQYMDFNKSYFERGGYFERGIHNEVDQYGGIAQVFSTYESRRAETEAPYTRGINSFQMIFDGQRWWITTLSWQIERPDSEPIPALYLPKPSP